jgi:ABC-type arginine/histidine transport system permease subunit
LTAISEVPDDGDRWRALAIWLLDNGRDDEAHAVRALWPTLRDNLACASLGDTLTDVARNAKVLAAVARKVERQVDETPPVGTDWKPTG